MYIDKNNLTKINCVLLNARSTLQADQNVREQQSRQDEEMMQEKLQWAAEKESANLRIKTLSTELEDTKSRLNEVSRYIRGHFYSVANCENACYGG